MKRWIPIFLAIVLFGFSLLNGQSNNPYVKVTGTLQGANGLPASNAILSMQPTQTGFVAGSGLSGNGYYPCQTGLGDGLNAIPAGTYLQSFCFNDSGAPFTITGIRCFTDNTGTSTMNVTDNSGNPLLTGPITCTPAFAAGTQSVTHFTIPTGGWAEFTFVSDGTSKQTTWAVTE